MIDLDFCALWIFAATNLGNIVDIDSSRDEEIKVYDSLKSA